MNQQNETRIYSVNTQHVLLVRLATCFGPLSGPSSGHNTTHERKWMNQMRRVFSQHTTFLLVKLATCFGPLSGQSSGHNTTQTARQIFGRYSNTKNREIPSTGIRAVPCWHTDRRTDRHDEGNSCFLQFCERVEKLLKDCSVHMTTGTGSDLLGTLIHLTLIIPTHTEHSDWYCVDHISQRISDAFCVS
jgi:hypothetical protein